MDITSQYYLEQIEKSRNKNHWKTRKFIKNINLLISQYRITANKFRGSYVAKYCSHEANVLENKLNIYLGDND